MNPIEIMKRIRGVTDSLGYIQGFSGLVYYYAFPDEGVWIETHGTIQEKQKQKEACMKILQEMIHRNKLSEKIGEDVGAIKTNFGIIVLAGDYISSVLKNLRLVIQ